MTQAFSKAVDARVKCEGGRKAINCREGFKHSIPGCELLKSSHTYLKISIPQWKSLAIRSCMFIIRVGLLYLKGEDDICER